MCHIYLSYSFVSSSLSYMSIFKKDCPECAVSNAIEAVRCRCGYCFDPDALAGADAAAYAEEQSRLYQDYLGARIVQAESELTVAREQAKADSSNTYKAAAALLAEQALNSLQAEMKQLAARLPAKRPATAAVAAAPARRSTATAPKYVAKSPPPTPMNLPRAQRLRAHTAPAAVSEKRPDVAAPKPAVYVPPAPPAVVAKAKPAEKAVPASPTTAKGSSVPVRRNTMAPVAVSAASARSKPSKASAQPNARFRNLQAQKADAIAKLRAFAPVAKVKRALSSVVATLTPAPAAVAPPAPAPVQKQARECPSCTATVASDLEKCRCGYAFSKATQEMPGISLAVLKTAGKEATQECPSCTASVPVSRERCNCGYTFAKSTEQVPALTLDAGALAILTEGIKPNNPSRRR
jgi:hypothetical protein